MKIVVKYQEMQRGHEYSSQPPRDCGPLTVVKCWPVFSVATVAVVTAGGEEEKQ